MEVFSCVIQNDSKFNVVECKVPNHQVGLVLCYMFENYLDAPEFGINLAVRRDDILKSEFQYKATERPATIKKRNLYVKVMLKIHVANTTTTNPYAQTFTYIPVCTLYPSTTQEQDFICATLKSSDRYVLEKGE